MFITKLVSNDIHPSIYTHLSLQVCGGLSSAVIGREVRYTSPSQTQDKQACTHTFMPKGNLETNQPNSHALVLWVEAIVTWENMKTMQKGQHSNPGPSCCKSTVLINIPPCSSPE
ncbi:hypothetical protein CHARACLAT_017434 [Characodon lateralis]|uniref:Uncharacterized protein n=1 Tax=Characodon lateralis TaxID=208331 RepID=A0ABU7DVZ1_9TELE|nr:hypothetical protein [Characodon lateralis]